MKTGWLSVANVVFSAVDEIFPSERSLEFLFEESVENENDVLFYGAVKLFDGNADEVFNIISSNENGVIFVCKKEQSYCFDEVINGLAELLGDKDKTLDFKIDIVKAARVILDKGSAALFPYAWEETGEYHLDIFLNSDQGTGTKQ